MMNTDALKDLMDALNKLFGPEMEDDGEEEDGAEEEGGKPAKGKKVTIVTIGKGKPDMGLKIPKIKKKMEQEDE